MDSIFSVMRWIVSRPRLALEASLVAALLFIGFRFNTAQSALAKANLDKGKLADGLRQEISVRDGQIDILKRENGKTISTHIYVPPEGSVVIKQKDLQAIQDKQAELTGLLSKAVSPAEKKLLQEEISRLNGQLAKPDVQVTVKDNGLTFTPGFRLGYSGDGIKPGLDIKFAYWGRYSALFGGDTDGLDVSASRHLDDILYGHPRNVELYVGYKLLRFSDGSDRYTIGLRANF